MILLHVFRWTFNKSWRGVALVLLFAVIALPKSGGPCNSGKDKRCKNCCDYRLMANDLHCSFPFVFVVLFSASRSEAKVFFDFLPNREFIDRFVCLSAALYPTKMLEYPGVGGPWWLLYARNEREPTFLLGFAQMRA
ncbi:MAG: hypothetical protein DVB27_04900 [Verrucomicrobia bacterium]|nr:MAG: hypothetical protein DVB27_04900 [Verrucomicrobiota bacterium]